MNSKIVSSMVFRPLAVCLLSYLTVACAGVNTLSPGAWVEQTDRIAVQDGGPHKGSWQTRDLTINYEYQQALNNLQVSAIIELADYIPKGFTTLEHLTLYIHFLEANGTVLATQSVRNFGYRRQLDLLPQMRFNNQFDLAENTVAFAFSYNGSVSRGSGTPGPERSGGRIDWDFWKVPRRSHPR
ncbi:MAG: hypothetical protein PVI71_10400 [Desulfobacterales bacterium]|jgi:hypothetical protein